MTRQDGVGGKVEIGAFRTFSRLCQGQAKSGVTGWLSDDSAGEDRGFWRARVAVLSLEVSHFKSTLDAKLLEALWNKYWVGTLSLVRCFRIESMALSK